MLIRALNRSFTTRPYSTTKSKSRSIFKSFLGVSALAFGAYTSLIYYSIDDEDFYFNFLEPIPKSLAYRSFLKELLLNPKQTFINQYNQTAHNLYQNQKIEPASFRSRKLVLINNLNNINTDNEELKQLVNSYSLFIKLLNDDGGATLEQEEILLDVTNKILCLNNIHNSQIKENFDSSKTIQQKEELIVDLRNKIKEAELNRERELKMLDQAVKNKDKEIQEEKMARHKIFEEELSKRTTKEKEMLERKFKREVRSLVENEKSNKLKKLDEIEIAYKTFENDYMRNTNLIDHITENIQHKIIVNELDKTYRYTQDPELIKKAKKAISLLDNSDVLISSLKADLENYFNKDKRYTKDELIRRFNQNVYEELKGCAMVKESNGFFGHLLSKFMSALLFESPKSTDSTISLQPNNKYNSADQIVLVQGAKKEIDSGNIENAARVLNQLSGWPKHIAKDFIKDCRTELEFDQNIKVINLELEYLLFKEFTRDQNSEDK